MTNKPNPSPKSPPSNTHTFHQQKAKPAGRVLNSKAIFDDIAEFMKQGGKIRRSGQYATATPRQFRGSEITYYRQLQKKAPTPIAELGKSAN